MDKLKPQIPTLIVKVAGIMEGVRYEELFEEVPDEAMSWARPDATKRVVNMDLVRELSERRIPGDNDLETAISLSRIVRAEFEFFGTDNSQVTLTDAESSAALSALRVLARRQGITFQPPWLDFRSFKAYWLAHEGRGSWKKRRDMVADVFSPLLEQLESIGAFAHINQLADPISPHEKLGWPGVDDHIEELRNRFRSASTVMDYKDVGNRCVGVLEALSAKVYDPAVHGLEDKPEPPVDKTDIRIGAYIDYRLPGSSNEELRGLSKKASALAHKTKHSSQADRTMSGIAADAVILLANILRRLEESEES